MENLQLSNFDKIVTQLRFMAVDDTSCLKFPDVKYKTVSGTIWRLKSEGMKFTTRKLNGFVYVWRIK